MILILALSLYSVPLAAGFGRNVRAMQRINKVTCLALYQSTISLLVTEFTYMEGRDADIVFK